MNKLAASVRLWLKQRYCEHFWRPATVHTKRGSGYIAYSQPSKYCDYCGKTVPQNLAEFYAQFGRMPF